MPPLPVPETPLLPALADNLAAAADYARAEKSDNTRKAYRSDWKHFREYCARVGFESLPSAPSTIAAYLASLADTGRSASTIARRLAAIAYAHKLKGLEPPTTSEAVRAVNRGIRRKIGTAVQRKAPATAAAIGAMLAQIPDTLAGKRDRAILLIGFAGALRRSELVALTVNDIERLEDGLLLHIRRSKSDQEGESYTIPIPCGTLLRPVEALDRWLSAAQLQSAAAQLQSAAALFPSIAKGGRVNQKALSDKSVAQIVKRYALAAGLDPAIFSGHSLRAGFVTSALEHGADLFKVMDVTRHKRIETLKIYDRRARAFRDHAGKDFL
jgi:site-specific recombinase XerD